MLQLLYAKNEWFILVEPIPVSLITHLFYRYGTAQKNR